MPELSRSLVMKIIDVTLGPIAACLIVAATTGLYALWQISQF